MGRKKKSKPGPGVVFDIVNETIARKLGREPLTFPSTADAMQAWLYASEEGLFPEPSMLNPKRLRLTHKTHKANVLDGSGS